MDRLKDLIFAYLLRLPFFLIVYTVIFVITRDESVFYLLLTIFTVLCTLDAAVVRIRLIVIMASTILAVVSIFFGLYEISAALMLFSLYRPDQYSSRFSLLLLFCLLVITVVVLVFIDSSLSYIMVRNVAIAAAATILARQIQTIDRFLGSYYCRGVSHKMALSVMKRTVLFAVVCMIGFVALSFFIRPHESEVIHVPNIFELFQEAFFPEHEEVSREEDDEFEGEYHERPNLNSAPPMFERETNELRMIDLVLIISVIVFLCIAALLLDKLARQPNPQFDDYDEEIEETSIASGKESDKRKRTINLGINYTIRRMFKRKVKEYVTKKGFQTQKSDTPKKLAETISEWENIEALQNLYHKARYSNEKIKRSELNGL